jgi:small subunit ribosomal protein S8
MAVIQDPIADMLTRIRNAQGAKHASCEMPGSKLKLAVAKILSQYGYVGDVEWLDEGPQGAVRIGLRYDNDGVPLIRKLQRISKPSRRRYVGAGQIPPVLNGLGLAVLSTSRGVISDREARAENIGGELLCTVY